jgi:hypothetical protein
MKERFLNLNNIGVRILAVIVVLLLGIPGCGWVLEWAGIHAGALRWIIQASLWIGVVLLGLFILLILIEQILDARLYRLHRQSMSRRILIGDGYAECPNCGFRGIRDFDSACPVCGKELSH